MKLLKISIAMLLATFLLNSCGKEETTIYQYEEPFIFFAPDVTTYFDEHPTSDKVIDKISAVASEGALSYSLVSSNPSNALGIHSTTGVLYVKDSTLFDYEKRTLITGEAQISTGDSTINIDISVYLRDLQLEKKFGNYDTTGFTAPDGLTTNFLFGTKHTLDYNGTLLSLNLIGKNTGADVQMALYEDNDGVPGKLIATSVIGSVNFDGNIALSVDPVNITAGDYWIMAVYNITGPHTYRSTVEVPTYYTSVTFGNDMPLDASGFTSNTYLDETYYMVVEL